jgi:hypothetical protein
MRSASPRGTPGLDYGEYVEERARGFTGREWALARIDRWVGQDGPRTFLLTGEPGSGKTALASRLLQVSRGQAGAGSGLPRLRSGFLSAVHFCSARAQSWISPRTFTESISLQLARYPAFARALAERAGDRRVEITVEQHDIAADAVTGVSIQRLDLSGIAPEDGFVRMVREPLEVLLAAEPELRICILIDALDEALLYSGPVGIVSLLAHTADLSDRVRFLLTSRPDEKVENAFRDAEALYLSAEEFTSENHDDVHRFVAGRLRSDAQLAAAVDATGEGALQGVTDAITERASGNFQYARFFLDAVAEGTRTLLDVDGLPAGLNALYFDSLQRVVVRGGESWATAYAPLMGVLSVAQESLTLSQLKALSGQVDPGFWEHRGELRQFIESSGTEADGGPRYRLYHQSLADFLRNPVLRIAGKELANTFYLLPREWHGRIADYYLRQFTGYWSDCDDEYGSRFVATHLLESSRECDRLERHRRTAQLVELVTDLEFQSAHQLHLEDLPALQRDLERAVESAATDRHPEAVPLVVEAALSLATVRRRYLRPEELFALAKEGGLAAAEHRLSLYAVELEWRQAILLILAWLATPANPAAAAELLARVVAEGVSPPLELLRTRIEADLQEAPLAALPSLPPPPDRSFVAAILERMGVGNRIGIEPLAIEGLEGVDSNPDSAPAYLAEQDGPVLVSFAATEPVEGTRSFRDYVAIHAANHYLHYRNRSLWMLIAPVLLHPDGAWVRERLVELAQAALADARIDFRDGLPLALEALRTHAAPAAPEESPDLDPWAHELRRLAVQAEVRALLLDDRVGAVELIQRALALPYGFAGFRATACLSLAEASSICDPTNAPAIPGILELALQAAHNIQDHVLCARATSRVNAMRAGWWPVPAATAAAFIASSDAPEFAALHRVGEDYRFRADSPHRLHLPEWARSAATLESIARLYERARTLVLQMNPAIGGADASLPPGTTVNIPDPEFIPLLAARFAAEALTAAELTPRARTEWIQALVPRAAANPTALDLVLTRLLLAARPTDAGVLARLIASVQRHVTELADTPASEIPLPPRGVPA